MCSFLGSVTRVKCIDSIMGREERKGKEETPRYRLVIHVGQWPVGRRTLLWDVCEGEQHDGYSACRGAEATEG